MVAIERDIKSAAERAGIVVRILGSELIGWVVQTLDTDNPGLSIGQVFYRARRLHGLLSGAYDLEGVRTWGRSWWQKSYGAEFEIDERTH